MAALATSLESVHLKLLVPLFIKLVRSGDPERGTYNFQNRIWKKRQQTKFILSEIFCGEIEPINVSLLSSAGFSDTILQLLTARYLGENLDNIVFF